MNEHVHEQLTFHLVDMTRTFAELKAAQSGMEASLKGQTRREKQELKSLVDALSSKVENLEYRLQEICVRLERFLPEPTLMNESGASPSYIS